MDTCFTVAAVLGSIFILFVLFKSVGTGREPKDIRAARREYERKVLEYKLQGKDYDEEMRKRDAEAVKKKVDQVLDDFHKKYPQSAGLEDEPASSSVDAQR